MPRKKLPFTQREFERFDYLTDLCCSHDQMDRIRGRLRLTAWMKEMGEEKSAALWAEIRRRDSGG